MKRILLLIFFVANCSKNSDFCSGSMQAPGCPSAKGEAMASLIDLVKKKNGLEMLAKNVEEEKARKRRQDFSGLGNQGYGSYGYGYSGTDGDGIIGN